MNYCNKCRKINGLEEGVLCKLLLIKPWETAKKSQKYIHYYLVIAVAHTEFSRGQCTYHYVLVPTTTKNIFGNTSLLKINRNNWFNNREVYLKLDEIFILQDFDFWIWNDPFEKKVSDFLPRLIIDSTINKWKLTDIKIWNIIQKKLNEICSKNRAMFFILDRQKFQLNSSYWLKKIRSKYVYCTNAFIPEWNDDYNIFFSNIILDIDNIRINNKFNCNNNYIENYKVNHFNQKSDEKKNKKIHWIF